MIRKISPMKSFAVVALLGMLLNSVFTAAVANMTPPDQVIKEAIGQALQELETRRDELSADKDKLYQTINDVLQPVVHFERVSKLVLGKHWRKASDQQKQDFMQEFKQLLLRTYATAIFEYSGEKINFKPFKDSGTDRVKVETEFVTKAGNPIPVIYSMSNKNDDRWRIYDVKIITPETATSLVQLYRSQYSGLIESRGFDGLIADLRAKNAQ